MLDHLEEAGFYSAKDLNSITKTLENMRQNVERGKEMYSPALLTLLQNRQEQCQLSLEKLQNGLAVLAPDLAPTHETLVSILRSTSAVNTRSKVRITCYGARESLADSMSIVLCLGSKWAAGTTEENRKFYERGKLRRP